MGVCNVVIIILTVIFVRAFKIFKYEYFPIMSEPFVKKNYFHNTMLLVLYYK